MAISWMFFASIGILFARYYKDILSDVTSGVWFIAHRIIMFTVVVLTLIGLVLILTALDWKWIESTNNNRLALTHSILGITAASLAIVQVFFK